MIPPTKSPGANRAGETKTYINPTTVANETQLLPHHNDSEIGVLQAVFCGAERGEPHIIDDILKIICPDDFYSADGGAVFRRAVEFHCVGRAFDRLLVEESFQGEDIFDRAFALINSLKVFTGETRTHCSKIVLNNSVRRHGIKLCSGAVERFYRQSESVPDILNCLIRDILALQARGAV